MKPHLCLIMKRYDCSLAGKIQPGPLGEGEIGRIGHSLCRTLEQLHHAGVVVQKWTDPILPGARSAGMATFGLIFGKMSDVVPWDVPLAFICATLRLLLWLRIRRRMLWDGSGGLRR